MKIAVCGAHKVGKTTLIEKLHEALPGYECKLEPYYELQEEGFAFSEVPTRDDYVAMLEFSIEQIVSSGDNIIYDRCPVDLLAYAQAVNDNRNFDIHSLYSQVQDVMNEIDLLVFVPVEKNDLIDCLESELPDLRKEVNDILSGWVNDLNTNLIEVHGSVEERCNLVLEKIAK